MTVQELITHLDGVKDKTKPVGFLLFSFHKEKFIFVDLDVTDLQDDLHQLTISI